jgi:hypothetical protein
VSTEWRRPYLELWRQEDSVNRVEEAISGALETVCLFQQSGGGYTWSSGGRRSVSTEWRRPYLELWRQEDSVNRVEEAISEDRRTVSTEWRRPYLNLRRQEDSVNRVEEAIPEALEAGGQCQQSGGGHT